MTRRAWDVTTCFSVNRLTSLATIPSAPRPFTTRHWATTPCAGWIQLVRSTDSASAGQCFEVDPIAAFRDVATHFAWFGIRPTLFDAPFQFSREDLSWLCHSCLCFVPDAVLSPRVRALAGFSWGFEATGGAVTLRRVDLPASAWNETLVVLREAYPGWTFDEDYRRV
jgi:hypothetical protein